jgi:ATP sulfurylase
MRVREMLRRVELPSPEDSRRKVAAVLLPWATPAQYMI